MWTRATRIPSSRGGQQAYDEAWASYLSARARKDSGDLAGALGGFKAIVVGKAGPDWTVFCQGRAAQLEVKTWKGKDRHYYTFAGSPAKSRRRAQYLALLEAVESGGCVGCYLVAWRHPSFEDGVEWRLYDVRDVPNDGGGLRFEREEGQAVPTALEGWPDWLGVIWKDRIHEN